jgi:hypothetical protein
MNPEGQEEQEDIPISSYSIKELNQLRELLMQSYTHYEKLLKDTAMVNTLKEGDKYALQRCFEETEAEVKELDAEIASRISQ